MAKYRVREDFGMYAVVEVRTGEIARVDDRWLECLDHQDAGYELERLNAEAGDCFDVLH